MRVAQGAREARRTAIALATAALAVLGTAGGAGATPADAAAVRAADPSAPPGGAAACTPGTVSWMPDPPPALAMLQGDLLAATTRGAGVLVAVVDSGVDRANPHLAGAVVGGVDLVGGSGAGGTDVSGHGTAIAGVIAARQVTGSGVVGVAPSASIYTVRVFTADSDEARRAGTAPTSERTAAGIRAGVDAGARVVNVSLSTTSDDADLRAAVAYAADHGALVVASAGNRATSQTDADGPRYPAAYPGVLAVAAVDRDGRPTDASIHGPHILLAAPGADVVTSATGAGDCRYAADAPESSFATAYVAGAAALVAAAHPDEGPQQWAYRLMATAARAHPDSRDDELGWGIVQPSDAIALVPGPSVRGPVNPQAGAQPAPAAGADAPLALAPTGSPWPQVRHIQEAVVLVALVALGSLAPLTVLRRRRQSATDRPDA